MATDVTNLITNLFSQYNEMALDIIVSKIKNNTCGITCIYHGVKSVSICLRINGDGATPTVHTAKLPDLKLEDWVEIDFEDISDFFDNGDIPGLRQFLYEVFFPKPVIENEE